MKLGTAIEIRPKITEITKNVKKKKRIGFSNPGNEEPRSGPSLPIRGRRRGAS
jgi:hypothetical protein